MKLIRNFVLWSAVVVAVAIVVAIKLIILSFPILLIGGALYGIIFILSSLT